MEELVPVSSNVKPWKHPPLKVWRKIGWSAKGRRYTVGKRQKESGMGGLWVGQFDNMIMITFDGHLVYIAGMHEKRQVKKAIHYWADPVTRPLFIRLMRSEGKNIRDVI